MASKNKKRQRDFKNILTRLLKERKNSYSNNQRELDSQKWFTGLINDGGSSSWLKKEIGGGFADDEFFNKTTVTNAPVIGGVYFFNYANPKYKETLEYYDAMPLVIPISYKNNGFLGINMHYLAPKDRMVFISMLLSNYVNSNNNKEYISFAYSDLMGLSNLYKKMIKHYIVDRVGGVGYVSVPQDELENVVFLNSSRFMKKSAREVWNG